jgi:aminoglycoside phosphotransferase (APT) family kinase protein
LTLEEVPLAGGLANAGAVVRVGDTVRRPIGGAGDAAHIVLEWLASAGFEAPRPLGVDHFGRGVFAWVEGEVPVPPFPAWATADAALASVGRILRRYHETVSGLGTPDLKWSDELRDPQGGPLVCHNDVCPENVVFREGAAVALLDFDFVAPGRAVWDVAAAASLCVPIGSGLERTWERVRVFVDGYGLGAAEREAFAEVLVERALVGRAFMRRRVAAGEPAFVETWASRGGEVGYERRIGWLRDEREQIRVTLTKADR